MRGWRRAKSNVNCLLSSTIWLIASVQALEEKSRRRDILVDEQELFEAYERHIPEGIYNEKLLAGWWHKAAKSEPKLLFFKRDDLIDADTSHITEQSYPEFWRQGNLKLPLSYHFEPSAEDDGVSVNIQLAILNQVENEGFDWHIPALREERITALIKSLPKPIRRNFVPAPNFAQAVFADIEPGELSLLEAMCKKLLRMTGVRVEPSDFKPEQIDAHLQMNFKILDGKKLIRQGRDLTALKNALSGRVQARLDKTAGQEVEREPLETWSINDLPKVVSEKQHGFEMRAYPAVTVTPDEQLQVQMFDHQKEAELAHARGIRALVLKQVPSLSNTYRKACLIKRNWRCTLIPGVKLMRSSKTVLMQQWIICIKILSQRKMRFARSPRLTR